jgi:hypothetical protein
MIANCRQLESCQPERLDRGLIVRQARQKRRRPDIVAGRHDDSVGVGRTQTREMRGEVLDTPDIGRANSSGTAYRCFERTVKVVDRKDLDLDSWAGHLRGEPDASVYGDRPRTKNRDPQMARHESE